MKFDGWEHILKKTGENPEKNHSRNINVACILAYYNGSQFIDEQIQSIFNQINPQLTITIFISDDNSSSPFPKLKFNNKSVCDIFYRKNLKNYGYSSNFIYSLSSIKKEFDYYCFSDQDDIWHEYKILNAINKIKNLSQKRPLLYCGRTTYYDEDCKIKLGNSIIFKKEPSFKNAIIQNIAGGNTMLFNKSANNLIISSIYKNFRAVSHDWWCYQIISGAGGIVIYDSNSYLKYRQHKHNVLGSNNTLKDRKKRIFNLIIGKFRTWNEINLYALNKNKCLLTEENKFFLEEFIKLRKMSLFKRIVKFIKIGIYRQTFIGNIALVLAVITKRV